MNFFFNSLFISRESFTTLCLSKFISEELEPMPCSSFFFFLFPPPMIIEQETTLKCGKCNSSFRIWLLSLQSFLKFIKHIIFFTSTLNLKFRNGIFYMNLVMIWHCTLYRRKGRWISTIISFEIMTSIRETEVTGNIRAGNLLRWTKIFCGIFFLVQTCRLSVNCRFSYSHFSFLLFPA